jgi:hypothetical protein
MNWLQENKFLSGFLAVMLVGVGALGFLFLSAKGQYEEAYADYEEKARELEGLVKRPIFPSQKNVDKLVQQKKQVTDKAADLAKTLAAQQIPVEEMTPAQFQDKLKAAVTALREKEKKTGKAGVFGDAPEKFFMGFEKYETAPPDAEAAVALGRQLKVIDWVVGKLIESGLTGIKVIRPELPEEHGKKKADDKKAAGGKSDKAAKVAVHKNPFEVEFVGEQASFKQALNAIIEYKGQFLIPRVVIVKNDAEKAPARVVAGAIGIDPAAAAAAAPPAPAATSPVGTPAAAPTAPTAPVATAPAANYIVGEEKVQVRLILEAVDFMEVASK